MERTTIFRSTDSRRARNSASVMIDRRRFAFRPSLRRCRLASRRVEPFSAVTSSPEPPLSPREPRPPRRRRRRRGLPLDPPDPLPFPLPFPLPWRLPFLSASASLPCAVAFWRLRSAVEPGPLPESDFPLLLALFSSEPPESLAPSVLSVPPAPPDPPEPPEPFRRPRPPRRRRRLPPPDGPGSPSAPSFEESSPAFSSPCSSCSGSSAAPAPGSA